MYLISDLTSTNPGIAALLWSGLGASIVLIGIGLRQHWRGLRLRPWLVLLAIALVVSGAVLAWSTGAWLGEAALIYGGIDGRPSESTPPSVTGSWPLVQAAAHVGLALGAIALFMMLNTTAIRQRRAARAHESGPG